MKHGQKTAGMKGVGEGLDTPGSEHIIEMIDRKDPRPVWIAAWSGVNTLAQALWKVKHTRKGKELRAFVSKIRVYDVLGQDDAGAWIVKNFPELTYIRNKEVYGWGPSDEWMRQNVQSVGVLGALYPNRIWAAEGDSPSFLYVVNNGLNVPEHLDWGGWGGRFFTTPVAGIRSMDWVERNGLDETQYDPYLMLPSAKEGCAAINIWKQDIYNDFAARMIWTVSSVYQHANHHPIAVIGRDRSRRVCYRKVKAGNTIRLDASRSFDCDNDRLVYQWIYYKQPSTYNGELPMVGDKSVAELTIPCDAKGTTIHVILRVTDNGTPSLSAYRRIVIVVS